MNKIFPFVVLMFTFLISFNSVNTYADGFNSVHTSDGIYIIAVGDGGRIFRSLNGGITWSSYSEPSVNFKSVFTLANDVWLSVDNGKIYKSSKTTTVLTPYNSGVLTSINSVFFLDENNGVACGDNGVVIKTVTGGSVWTTMNTGITTVNLNSIHFKDASNGIVVGNNGKVFMTVNGGVTWTPETVATTRNILDVGYFQDGIAFAGEWGTLLTKANGSSWTSINTKIITDIRSIAGSSINDVHICGGGGFIRNNKNGSVNFETFEKNPMLANLVDIVYFGNTGFAVSSLNNAVIRTINGGTTWELPSGTAVSMTWQTKPGANGSSLGDNLCAHPTDRNTIFTNFTGRTYVSRNRGEIWSEVGTQIPSATKPHSFYVSSLDTNIWVCATEANGGDKVARTTNYGQTWNTSIAMNFSNYGEPLQIDPNNPSVFYFAPDNGGFYKSADNGLTFSEISHNYPFRSPCDIMVSYDDANVIFLADGTTGTGLADLFKSSNGGASWTLKFSNPSSSEIPNMSNTIFDSNVAWFTNWPGGGIYKSVNSGENWSLNHTNLFSGWGMDICDEDPDFIMTGSWSDNKSSFTTNGGETWTTVPGLNGNGGVMLLVDRGYIIGQAGSNVYKLNILYSITTSITENTISNITKSFNLSQNYPNPFNPTTRIQYDLSKSGTVVLKVYSELGREINTLVNAFKGAGTHEITFDASEYSSGIYFYKLESEGLVSTKKMILVK